MCVQQLTKQGKPFVTFTFHKIQGFINLIETAAATDQANINDY